MSLNSATVHAILNLQKKYPERRSALIPALHLAQADIGYLPADIQAEVAALFDLAPIEVNVVVTFYDMFFEEPVGKHIIHVCKNISCMLRGADDLLSHLCDRLHVIPGGTTADGEFTVIASECLASCDKAPMMLVDEKIIGPVKQTDLAKILDEAKSGAGHPSPVEVPIHG